MRALPAGSLEYFGATALGNTALVAAAGVAGFAGAVAAVPVDAGAAPAFASAPHSALRKSFHFIPLAVPAAWAALYLALHSFMVSACVGDAIVAAAAIAAAQMTADRTCMTRSPCFPG